MNEPDYPEGTEPDDKPLDADELSVNALSRFTKTSSTLILEEHNHCEVPAGCGGVVLRWVNPNSPVVLGCRVFGAVHCRVIMVGGEEYRTSRLMLTAGSHVVVLVLNRSSVVLQGRPERAVMAAVSTDFGSIGRTGAGSPDITVVSSSDGSWQLAVATPTPEAMTALQPDPAMWTRATTAERPERPDRFPGYYDDLVDRGAEALALPPGTETLWLRTVIHVPQTPGAEP
ncbi:MAG: hypothetical protein AAFX99_06435 [Myxococcota bacterium]